MSFKELYIAESLKMGRYEKSIADILKSLRESLFETMPYLKDYVEKQDVSSIKFKLKLDFEKFKKAYSKITSSNEFSKYGHKFITLEVPEYKDPKKIISVNIYFCLDDETSNTALTSTENPEILIFFNHLTLLSFIRKYKSTVNFIEDAIVHELTHIVDPSMKSKDMLKKTVEANTKYDKGQEEDYFKLPWEKAAFHTQNVRRMFKDIVHTKEFIEIANSKDVKKVSKYLMDKVRGLKEYLDGRIEILDRNKIYKEIYKEIDALLDRYKKSIEGK